MEEENPDKSLQEMKQSLRGHGQNLEWCATGEGRERAASCLESVLWILS